VVVNGVCSLRLDELILHAFLGIRVAKDFDTSSRAISLRKARGVCSISDQREEHGDSSMTYEMKYEIGCSFVYSDRFSCLKR